MVVSEFDQWLSIYHLSFFLKRALSISTHRNVIGRNLIVKIAVNFTEHIAKKLASNSLLLPRNRQKTK